MALTSSTAHDVELTFAPRAGASVAKRAELVVELVEMTILIDGRDFASENDEVVRLVTSLAFVDTYARVTDGVPRDFQRRFDEVAGFWEYNGDRNEIEELSALAGCTVRFEWLPEREEHVRSVVVDQSDVPQLEDRLGELVEDLDLRAFLPCAPIQPGCRWTAEGEPLMHALFGPLESSLVGIPAGVSQEAVIRDVLLRPFQTLGNEELDVQCVLARVARDESDPEMEIELSLVDRFELDVTSAVNECFRAGKGIYNQIVIAGAVVAWRCDGKGQLVWDTLEQRFASLDLKVRAEVDLRIDFPSSSGILGLRDHSLQLLAEFDATWSMVAEDAPKSAVHD